MPILVSFFLILNFCLGLPKGFCQSFDAPIDSVLVRATGAFYKDGSDSIKVRFKGEDLSANLIFSFNYNSKTDHVIIEACDFPDYQYYFETLSGCLEHNINSAKRFGYFKIEEFDVRSFFSNRPRKYHHDDMQDIEIKSGVFANYFIAERIRANFWDTHLTDELLNEVLLDIYSTSHKRNQVTLYGPYEFIYTFVWSNVLNKALSIDSPYGL